MAESHIVSGLVEKRSEIAGLIEHHCKEMGHLASALGHLDATLKLFAPEINLRTLRVKQHRARNILFRPGEMPRFILDTLRRAGGPLTSRTLTNHGTLVQGPDEGPAHTWLIA